MVSNENVAAILRSVAQLADDDMAQHDIETLADAIESLDTNQGPQTHEELHEALDDEFREGDWGSGTTDRPTYIPDRLTEEFLDAFPNWKLVDKKGRNAGGPWQNFPVRRDE